MSRVRPLIPPAGDMRVEGSVAGGGGSKQRQLLAVGSWLFELAHVQVPLFAFQAEALAGELEAPREELGVDALAGHAGTEGGVVELAAAGPAHERQHAALAVREVRLQPLISAPPRCANSSAACFESLISIQSGAQLMAYLLPPPRFLRVNFRTPGATPSRIRSTQAPAFRVI